MSVYTEIIEKQIETAKKGFVKPDDYGRITIGKAVFETRQSAEIGNADGATGDVVLSEIFDAVSARIKGSLRVEFPMTAARAALEEEYAEAKTDEERGEILEKIDELAAAEKEFDFSLGKIKDFQIDELSDKSVCDKVYDVVKNELENHSGNLTRCESHAGSISVEIDGIDYDEIHPLALAENIVNELVAADVCDNADKVDYDTEKLGCLWLVIDTI